MQLTPSQGKFIEKIIRNKDGKLVRAIFCVYQNGGRIKARLVEVVYLPSEISNACQTFLTGSTAENTFSTLSVFEKGIISPFFSLNLLYSFGSKPRAPTV